MIGYLSIIFETFRSNYLIVSRRVRKVFGGYKKIEKWNSASMCKCRPDGHNSTTALDYPIVPSCPTMQTAEFLLTGSHFFLK